MAAEHSDVHETISVPAAHGHDAGHDSGPLSPDAQMVVWTWATFGLVALILYKVAWKPILAALDAREARIRQALRDADETARAVAELDATCAAMKAEADRESRAIIAQARDAAQEAAAQIEQKANERLKVLYENAERDIEALRNRVIADIRREQADLVVNAAGRLIGENLTDEKNRALADRLIAEF